MRVVHRPSEGRLGGKLLVDEQLGLVEELVEALVVGWFEVPEITEEPSRSCNNLRWRRTSQGVSSGKKRRGEGKSGAPSTTPAALEAQGSVVVSFSTSHR